MSHGKLYAGTYRDKNACRETEKLKKRFPGSVKIVNRSQRKKRGYYGLPYREKRMNIISIVLDAPQEKVSALSGKLGMIPGVSSKCLYAQK